MICQNITHVVLRGMVNLTLAIPFTDTCTSKSPTFISNFSFGEFLLIWLEYNEQKRWTLIGDCLNILIGDCLNILTGDCFNILIRDCLKIRSVNFRSANQSNTAHLIELQLTDWPIWGNIYKHTEVSGTSPWQPSMCFVQLSASQHCSHKT